MAACQDWNNAGLVFKGKEQNISQNPEQLVVVCSQWFIEKKY